LNLELERLPPDSEPGLQVVKMNLVLVKIQAHLTKITAQKSAKPWC
jgi:hypothetical protein